MATSFGSTVTPLKYQPRCQMRVSELVKVRAVDLRLDEEYLTCVGKGNKERIIPIGEQATEWVRRYQQEGRSHLMPRAKAALADDVSWLQARRKRS